MTITKHVAVAIVATAIAGGASHAAAADCTVQAYKILNQTGGPIFLRRLFGSTKDNQIQNVWKVAKVGDNQSKKIHQWLEANESVTLKVRFDDQGSAAATPQWFQKLRYSKPKTYTRRAKRGQFKMKNGQYIAKTGFKKYVDGHNATCSNLNNGTYTMFVK